MCPWASPGALRIFLLLRSCPCTIPATPGQSPHSPPGPPERPHPSICFRNCSSRTISNMADAMDFEDVDFETHLDDDNGGESQRKRRKRVRNWTAEDRARHRVFERSRREAFNERLNVGVSSTLTMSRESDVKMCRNWQVCCQISKMQRRRSLQSMSSLTRA